MTVVLNHTIVPVADKERGARLLADLLDMDADAVRQTGHFAALQVNADLTFDFDDRAGARSGHYAFLVDDGTFDHALGFAKDTGLPWGSSPRINDYDINHHGGGRGVYIRDPDGIAYEFFTAVPS